MTRRQKVITGLCIFYLLLTGYVVHMACAVKGNPVKVDAEADLLSPDIEGPSVEAQGESMASPQVTTGAGALVSQKTWSIGTIAVNVGQMGLVLALLLGGYILDAFRRIGQDRLVTHIDKLKKAYPEAYDWIVSAIRADGTRTRPRGGIRSDVAERLINRAVRRVKHRCK